MDSGQADKRVKVTPEEVMGELQNQNGDHITAAKLADIFDVCTATIRSKIRQLRMDNEPIIHTADGYILIDREWLENSENAVELKAYQDWFLSILMGLNNLASPIRPLLPQMRRTLAANTSREERSQLMRTCAKTMALIALTDAEEEA